MFSKGLIPLATAAKRIGLSEHTLRQRLVTGRSEGEKLGRDWFIPIAEVDRLARKYPLSDLAQNG